MASTLTLLSHPLCPYVQRAAIVLAEKGIAYRRVDIDLSNTPAWFREVSPLGKTPVLLVDGQAVFESAVICEYLDDTSLPRMHPADPLARARHRAWIEFASVMINTIGAMYNAADEVALRTRAETLNAQMRQLEATLAAAPHGGPFFAGPELALVDAAFAPMFRYFDVFDTIADFGVFDGAPQVRAWRAALQRRPSVQSAVRGDHAPLLRDFLLRRNSALSLRMRR